MTNYNNAYGYNPYQQQYKQYAFVNGISFDTFNEYDWNYVMNMIYSDYYGAISNDTNAYVRLAKKFLEDKDAKEGKALCYYLAMK